MASANSKKILSDLANLKHKFGENDAKLLRGLQALSRSSCLDAELLIQFHESLLFLRAYPPSTAVLETVESILEKFSARVAALRSTGADLSLLDNPEVSGITDTTVTSNFSYPIVRWLVSRYPKQLSIDWDWFEEEDRFGVAMPRFLPLLEEEAMVEAHVPYRQWMNAGRGRTNELRWLIERFESLNLSARSKAELYDSLKLHVTWQFAFRSSRTGMKMPVRNVFFHDQPLIGRRDVSLSAELNSPRIPIERVSSQVGGRILEMARGTSAVRYRELHGFTYGDPRCVFKAALDRGVEAFVFCVPPQHRLPLRAYHAAMIFKNGVPIGYFEGLSLFERMESGFNLYYTFRDGETAWLYARILRLMKQMLGVTVFSIDPYQVGHENEEGIESGAYWFYRKLGFRPVRADLMKLTSAEEEKIAGRSNYRTSPRTLRRLAAGHMLLDARRQSNETCESDWDGFAIRNVGLAVQQRMADRFAGDAEKIRMASVEWIKRTLGLKTNNWRAPELLALQNFAPLVALIPDIQRWNPGEKQLCERIIRAKSRNDESTYLRLMQKHSRLRARVIEIGSKAGIANADRAELS